MDKAQFSEMFVKQTQKTLQNTTSNLVENVNKLSIEFEKEMVSTIEIFKKILLEETSKTKDKIMYAIYLFIC